MTALYQDLRHAARLALRSPGYTAAVVLTLAFGIAANCSMFAVLNTVLLRPLPYKDAEHIVEISQSNTQRGIVRQLTISAADYLDWKEQNQVFDLMAAWNFQYFNLSGSTEPERVEGFRVTADFFPILGVGAALGRTFAPEDDQPGQNRSVVLSDGIWRRRFGADPRIAGQSITVDGEQYTVLGVLPPHFRLFRVLNRELDVFVPMPLDRAHADRSERVLFVYAHLRSGVSLPQAQTAMDVISQGIEQRYPTLRTGWRADVVPLQQQWTGPTHSGLLLLQAAVGFVLLIGCANIANLALARAEGRKREMAIRTALGAAPLRLIRQLLSESLLLAVPGGALGTALAILLTNLLERLPYNVLNRVAPFRIDASVLAFSLGITLLTGLVVGLLPALQCSTPQLKPEGLRRRRSRNLLIVAQVGLAVMLLTSAGLLIRSSMLVANMNRGLNPRHVLTAQIWLPPARYKDGPQVARFWREATDRVAALPGVVSASAVNFPPLSVMSFDVAVRLEGQPPQNPGQEPRARQWVVGPRYFETLEIPLLQGRQFTDYDRDESHGVVIVSVATAQRFWPGEPPIGKRIRPMFPEGDNFWEPKSSNPWLTVVGVVGDVHLDGVLPPQAEMYLPYAQIPSSIMHLVIRTAGNPSLWIAPVRTAIRSLDQDQPIFDVKSLEDVLAESVARPSALMRLLTAFASAALSLAALGVYGVVAFFVSQRAREIGIRIALGARRAHVVRFVMAQGLGAVLVGVAFGMAGALATARMLRTLLVGVTTTDATAFIGMPAVLILVAIVATYIPAQRAANTEPMTVLRSE